jgi:hypothetical protein
MLFVFGVLLPQTAILLPMYAFSYIAGMTNIVTMPPHPVFLLRWGLTNFLPRLTLNTIFLDLYLLVTGMSHHAQPQCILDGSAFHFPSLVLSKTLHIAGETACLELSKWGERRWPKQCIRM